jgi:hypothetical protein
LNEKEKEKFVVRHDHIVHRASWFVGRDVFVFSDMEVFSDGVLGRLLRIDDEPLLFALVSHVSQSGHLFLSV